jgi:hypothetical protein
MHAFRLHHNYKFDTARLKEGKRPSHRIFPNRLGIQKTWGSAERPVCTENLIGFDDVTESPKLGE